MRKNYRLTISYDGTRYQGWQKQKKTGETIQGKLEDVLQKMMPLYGVRSGPGTSADEAVGSADMYRTLSDAPGGSADKYRTSSDVPGGSAEMYRMSSDEPDSSVDKYRTSSDAPDGSAGAGSVEGVQVIGAGRTDAGVHAKAMTANVFLDITIDEDHLRNYLNRYLPDDISVDAVKIASDRFHSRFQAIAKTYCYTCYHGVAKPVFDRKYVTILEHHPNVERMRRASEDLLGNHDFKAFCGNPKMKKSTWRRIDAVEIIEEGDYIRFYIRGNAFLQNMVRIITGTLLEIGFGRMPADAIPKIIASLDRTQAGPTAPAKGLCLVEVHYD